MCSFPLINCKLSKVAQLTQRLMLHKTGPLENNLSVLSLSLYLFLLTIKRLEKNKDKPLKSFWFESLLSLNQPPLVPQSMWLPFTFFPLRLSQLLASSPPLLTGLSYVFISSTCPLGPHPIPSMLNGKWTAFLCGTLMVLPTTQCALHYKSLSPIHGLSLSSAPFYRTFAFTHWRNSRRGGNFRGSVSCPG